MKRTINVPTLGGVYTFTANSPEDEEIIRKAAKAVNNTAEGLQMKFPGKTEAEIARMLALNERVRAARLQKQVEDLEKELETLHKELESYLENIVKI